MSAPMLKTVFFLSSFLATTSHAFIPVEYPPVPSDLDTNQWVPFTTLEPITTSISTPTATPTTGADRNADNDLRILPALDANLIPDIKRQVTGQGAAAAATAIKQVSPVTTYYIQSVVSGSAAQVPVVYTQTFPTVWDPWPGPTAGEIGLGTIQGTVGVVRTNSKRSLPTQAPLGEPVSVPVTAKEPEVETQGPAEEPQRQETEIRTETGQTFCSSLKKLRTVGNEIMALLSRPQHLEKQGKLAPSSPSPVNVEEQDSVVPVANEQKKHGADAITKAKSTVDASDARVLKAGTLTVFAVGVAAMCINHL